MTFQNQQERNLLCGYEVLRYLPSRDAYRARVAVPGTTGLVDLRCVAPGFSVDPSDVASEGPFLAEYGPLDVGRTARGDLVLVEAVRDERTPRMLRSFSLLTESSADTFSSPMLGGDTYNAPKDETPAGAALKDAAPKDAAPQEDALRSVRSGSSRMLRWLTLKWDQIAVNHESLRILVRKRGIRLLATFVGVGLVLLAILLGGIGGTGSGAPAEAGLTTSAPQPVIREQASEDPVGYAIAEVQAGRVIGLEDDSSSSAVVEGKVLSRNGEIVLVEVTRVAGDKKTFATLLLQKMEGGWRTRDVFDAAN